MLIFGGKEINDQNDKIQLQEIVSRRNTETFKKMFADMHERLNEQDKKINSQQNAIGTLTNKIISLENQLLTFKVKSTGTGPSVKNV